MHKLLLLLLCCGVNEEEDRLVNNKNSKVSQTTTPKQSTPTNISTTKQKTTPKKLKEEDSINESETITNTNDTDRKKEDPVIAAENIEETQDREDPLATGTYVDQVEEDSSDAATAETAGIDMEQPSNHMLDMQFLQKLQPGQAFNDESGWLLPKKTEEFKGKKCLILDLDETLVHSSFKYLRTADFVIPVEIDQQIHHVYVIKRPGVDEFLKKVGQWFEVVVFTASVAKYGDPLLNKLDINHTIHHRLFRDSCYNYQGNFIKNLSQIGRPLADSIIIDNSPASYIFHPQHSIPISSWFSDTHDNELLDLLPFLKDILEENVDDVGLVLDILL